MAPIPTQPGKKRNVATSAAVSAATGMSWMALVAATTFGTGELDCIRAEISSDDAPGAEDDESLRLIVQSYEAGSVDAQGPSKYARPLGSIQRAITPEELKKGVSVDLVNVRRDESGEAPVVVAWIERGEPTLELDARRARPDPGRFLSSGEAEISAGHARVVLSQAG